MKQKMDRPKVCGVLVTYHPTIATIGNISAIIEQVEDIVVVDNGSTADEIGFLREASRTLKFGLIENGENLGIADALNQGVAAAISKNFLWVLLFDQDSRITPAFVDAMFREWDAHMDKHRIVTVQPRYIDPATGSEAAVRRIGSEALACMTSGTLLPTWAFDVVGWFLSEYFIDYVDIEYSLRARSLGYFSVQAQEAVLLHKAGNPTTRRLLGFVSYQPSNHDATRRYYIMRNRIATARRYFRLFPFWVIRDLLSVNKDVVKIVTGERQRREKLHAMLRGAIDGVRGRMGKMTPIGSREM